MNIIMNNKKILTSFAIILSLILVSGCLGAGKKEKVGTIGEDSLEIMIDTEGMLSFDSKQDFIITMAAENFGPFDLENVTTNLIGYDGISHKEVGVKLSDEQQLALRLDRPRPDLDMLGGSSTFDWPVTAPTVAETSPPLEVMLTGEIYYRTKSLGTQRVVVADRNYVTQMKERGEAVPVNPSTESLNGPISINVDVPEPFVSTTGTSPWFRVKVVLNNDGSGNLYARTLNSAARDRDYLEELTLKVPAGLTVDLANCDFNVTFDGDAGENQEDNAVNADIEKNLFIDATSPASKKVHLRLMEGGLTRTVDCRLKVDEQSVTGYQTFELYTEAEYTYLQDILRPITILGVPE